MDKIFHPRVCKFKFSIAVDINVNQSPKIELKNVFPLQKDLVGNSFVSQVSVRINRIDIANVSSFFHSEWQCLLCAPQAKQWTDFTIYVNSLILSLRSQGHHYLHTVALCICSYKVDNCMLFFHKYRIHSNGIRMHITTESISYKCSTITTK